MALLKKIPEDLKEALKSRRELELSVLRMLSSAIKNREIEKRGKGQEAALNEDEVIAVIRSEVKKRKDSIEQFKKGGRQDLANKEAKELEILEKYLPQELSDEEIKKIAKEVVFSHGDAEDKDFGKIMGSVMGKIKGQAGGGRVAVIVRKMILK